MKRKLFLLLLLLLALNKGIQAQVNITYAEYFFDNVNDPGRGNATSIPIITPADSLSFQNMSISTASLTLPGNHALFVRTKDNTGKWSLYGATNFFIQPKIISAEYSIDTVKPYGSGTPFAIGVSSDSISLTNQSIPTAGLTSGYHNLFASSRDDLGRVSLYGGYQFFIQARIIRAEYFIDNDPGIGLATNISPFTASDSISMNLSIPTIGLTPGFHRLVIRSRDENGKWSLYGATFFYVNPTIIQAEYYVDNDPGFGSATQINPTHSDSISSTFSIPTTVYEFTPGFHKLFARSRDNTGKWSLYGSAFFYIQPRVDTAEYYFDNDPGFGLGTQFTPLIKNDSISMPNYGASVAALPVGPHKIFARSKDASGRWSLYASGSFYRCTTTGSITPSVSTSICVGSSVSLTMTPTTTEPSPVFTYSWSPATGLNSTTLATVSASPSVTTTYTATVLNTVTGCYGTSSVIVNVNTPPAITVVSNITVSNTSGQCNGIATYTPTITGSPAPSLSCTFTGATTGSGTGTTGSGNGFNVGVTNVQISATNVCNTATRSFTVTVMDVQSPSITCPANVTANANSGVCVAIGVALGSVLTSDNCALQAPANNGLSSYPVGNTTVKWTISDVNGNTNFCNQTVNVIDNQVALISCPSNVSANANNGVCFATSVSLGTSTSTDNCSVAGTSNNALSQYNVGPTTVTWTVTDVNGNTNSCNQTVIVIDNQIPLITCPNNVTANANSGVCFATSVALGASTSTDNCSVAGTSNNAQSQYNAGPTTVTWTVTDVNGKTNSCNQTVTVIDNQVPIITCPNNVTANSNSGVCFATSVALGTSTSTDNCSVAGTSNNAQSQYNVGPTTVTWTVIDVNGKTNSCNQTVTVIDNQIPLITCPNNVTANSNSGVCFATSVALGTSTSTDNCSVAGTSNNAQSQYNEGPTTVTWTVTDVNGKTNSCNQTVTVIDNQVPLITCPNNVTANANSGVCFATSVALGTSTSTDNCSVAGTSNNAQSQYNVGPATVTWTVTDVNGKTNSCNQTVTVIDNQIPLITCPNNVTANSNSGVCFATSVALGTSTSTDNCSVAGTSNNAQSQYNAGPTTVTWTVTDVNGKTNSCNQTVTVIDNQVPLITCPNNVTANANSGVCFATSVALGTSTSTDNCSVAGTSNNAQSQYNVGPATVTWTVTDVNGKTNSCNQTVTVIDNQAPTFSNCPANITIACTGNATWTPPSASDNCGVQNVVSTHNPNTSFGVGITTVIYTGTDIHGNTTSCSFTITVNPFVVAITLSAYGGSFNVHCYGSNDGTAMAVPLSGSGPFTYLWSNGQTTQTATGLSAVSYTVTVSSGSCTATKSATLSQPAILSGNVSTIGVSAPNNTDGSATANPTGGVVPYNYLWNNSQTTQTIGSIGSGTFTVTITDANGCQATISAIVSQSLPCNPITITSVVSNVKCKGTASGSIAVTPSGGTSPYSFLWSNGKTTSGVTLLIAGTYIVMIHDANGCTTTSSFTITQAGSILSANMEKFNIKCGGTAKGKINAIPTGGIPPYTYLWSLGLTTVSINNLVAVTYTCTVTDAAGCSKTAVIPIKQNVPMVVILAPTSATTAHASVTGGVPPYYFNWNSSPAQTTATAILIPGNTYKVRVTDSANCSKISNFTMPIPRLDDGTSMTLSYVLAYPNPTTGIINIVGINCNDCNVSLSLTDITGRLIFHSDEIISSERFEKDFSFLKPGVYLLQIILGDETKIIKVVKE